MIPLLAMSAMLGCDDQSAEVQFYPAPKDVPRVEPVADAHGHGPRDAGDSTTLTWTVPSGWRALPAQQMRVATFAINEGDSPVQLTVIPLGPEAGDVLANVNRWERLLGLPASSEEALDKVVQHVDVNELHVDVVDITGAESQSPRQRMLAAIVPHGGKTWFFKAVGPVDIVTAQKANFDAFIASLKPGPADGAAKAQASDGATATTDPARPLVTATLAKWATPEGWTQQAGAQPPRIVAFDVGPADKKAEMVVTSFAPDNAGGFRDNINRWRRQIGLEPITDPNALKMEDAVVGKDFRAIVLDFENPAEPAKRMYVAIASVGGEFWFLKLTGPADVVAQQRNAFDAFLKSLEFKLAPAGNAPATQPATSP